MSQIVATVIGIASAIIDNVPLVAATMGMYTISDYPMDDNLWQVLLALVFAPSYIPMNCALTCLAMGCLYGDAALLPINVANPFCEEG